MATILNIVHGSTTIQLNAGTYALLEYTPRTPDEREIVVETAFNDGGERPVAAYRNVTEVARVALLGDGAATALRTAKAAIDLALSLARRRQQRGLGDRVYVEYRPDGYTETYRCEVLGGRVELADEALGWQWADRNIEILIGWQRRFYWEGPETQLPLTNPHHAAYVFSAESSDPSNAVSGYANITGVTDANSNAGRLYFYVYQGMFPNDAELSIFADEAGTQLVGHIATGGIGVNAIIADGGSGLGGTITLDALPAAALATADWDYDRLAQLTVYNHSDAGHVN